MGTAAMVIRTFQSDEWNADVYGTLSAVSAVAARMKDKAFTLHLAYSLHKLNRQLQAFFDKVHAVAEGKLEVESTEQPPTSDRAREMASDMMRMYRSTDRVYQKLSKAGYLNNSLTAGQIVRFRKFGDEMLDLADFFETAIHSEEVSALFDRSSEERDRGEIYDFDQVK